MLQIPKETFESAMATLINLDMGESAEDVAHAALSLLRRKRLQREEEETSGYKSSPSLWRRTMGRPPRQTPAPVYLTLRRERATPLRHSVPSQRPIL